MAVDSEGHATFWDITTKKVICSGETDCNNPLLVFFTEDGEKVVMVCENGTIITFDNQVQQTDFCHVGYSVQYARMIDSTHVMVATENKELVTFDLSTRSLGNALAVNTAEPIRCFDITADGKYAVVVSNEIQFWNMTSMQCEANLCPVLSVRCMCLTGDFISFFMSQDTHIEKWVIDWKIVFEGKKYYPPLSNVVMHDTGVKEEKEEEDKTKLPAATFNNTIETVNEEEEEEEED